MKALIVVPAAILALLWTLPSPQELNDTQLKSAQGCYEDEPCWDCRYDGNQICGPDNAQGVLPGDYSDQNCWPGAVYCPPDDTASDSAQFASRGID